MYSNIATIQNMAFADCVSLSTIEILDVPTVKFIKVLLKSTEYGNSLQTILCYSHMFIYRGEYVVYPRKSSCKMVSKKCWVGYICGFNTPHILNIIDQFCGPTMTLKQAVSLSLVLNKIR